MQGWIPRHTPVLPQGPWARPFPQPLHFSVGAHHPENEEDGEAEAVPLLRT